MDPGKQLCLGRIRIRKAIFCDTFQYIYSKEDDTSNTIVLHWYHVTVGAIHLVYTQNADFLYTLPHVRMACALVETLLPHVRIRIRIIGR